MPISLIDGITIYSAPIEAVMGLDPTEILRWYKGFFIRRTGLPHLSLWPSALNDPLNAAEAQKIQKNWGGELEVCADRRWS